jgi:hypothetical protein
MCKSYSRVTLTVTQAEFEEWQRLQTKMADIYRSIATHAWTMADFYEWLSHAETMAAPHLRADAARLLRLVAYGAGKGIGTREVFSK